jgi:L-Ala-D/L-Glu epimerase
MASIRLVVSRETWPIAGTFNIARGSKNTAEVVVARLERGGHTGRGECVPYGRYGETVDGTVAVLEQLRQEVERGLDRHTLQRCLPAGAARNALDCAFWDLEAKEAGVRVYELADLDAPAPVATAYTLSLDTPDAMGRAAAANATRPVLKLKLAGEGDLARVEAVRRNAPQARLVVDANEGWDADMVEPFSAQLAQVGVALVEQPLPAENDAALASLNSAVPLCADESCHTAADIERLVGLYSCVNIKLDKSGGLTEALGLYRAARAAGLQVMVGCMVGTSLGMAPAALLAGGAEYVDLDGPLLLQQDRQPGLRYEGSVVFPPDPELWG